MLYKNIICNLCLLLETLLLLCYDYACGNAVCVHYMCRSAINVRRGENTFDSLTQQKKQASENMILEENVTFVSQCLKIL